MCILCIAYAPIKMYYICFITAVRNIMYRLAGDISDEEKAHLISEAKRQSINQVAVIRSLIQKDMKSKRKGNR